ncbi:MAG: DUF6169 family protein [Flavobacterium sp.]
MTYPFLFIGGVNNSYTFETDNAIAYEIKFKPSPYLFSGNEFSELIFEFVIDIAINESGKNPPLDYLVSETIAEIFKEFFNNYSKNVCIYICDSSNNRQDIRRKKFDQWFYKYQNDSFIKVDEILVDSNKNRYPISMIILKRNPYIKQIISAFIELSEGESDK